MKSFSQRERVLPSSNTLMPLVPIPTLAGPRINTFVVELVSSRQELLFAPGQMRGRAKSRIWNNSALVEPVYFYLFTVITVTTLSA